MMVLGTLGVMCVFAPLQHAQHTVRRVCSHYVPVTHSDRLKIVGTVLRQEREGGVSCIHVHRSKEQNLEIFGFTFYNRERPLVITKRLKYKKALV